ncbi:uncharacterized protein LOC122086287 [Macadamia integrifolia]|uniref:uncharacterized protein LOC122086287 n=1 Tax=Macadamia integrifolia TaxID=60698 RepID=UPI001C5002BB|nr:uncharacterized protein LOC122086287 [Macadamia integrifolia]
MALARLHEQKNNDMKRSWKPTVARNFTGPGLLPTPPTQALKPPFSPSTTILPIKKLTPMELKARREKGLCYNCDEQYTPGHKCKSRFLLLMVDDESKEDEENQIEGEPTLDSVEEGLPEISLHALAGPLSPSTIRLTGTCNKLHVHVLIDSGSTHNFVQEKVANMLSWPVFPSKPFKVFVGNGEYLSCTKKCVGMTLELQGHTFTMDLFVLPIQGVDIVLGIRWLSLLGPIVMDYQKLTMDFTWKSSPVHFQGEPQFRLDPISAKHVKKLAATHSIASYFHLKGYQFSSIETETTKQTPEIQSILEKFSEVFEEPKRLPPSRTNDHQIHLIPGATPVNVRPYRYPQFQKTEIERDRFPIPTVEELLDELHGACFFSKLDLRSGYHQIRMQDSDIYKTAFRTHQGHYEFVVMPFGLTNAPSTFQSIMNQLFQPFMRKFVTVFFDDILVYSKTLLEHVYHLELVLGCLKTNHLYAKLSKCSFCQASISYLGHIVSAAGVSPDPEKISAMQDWPQPRTIKHLRGFLGLTGYYRKFVHHYASIAFPLTNLLKKEAFHWNESAQKAFDRLKEAMIQVPVLSLPNFDKDFELETDASNVGIGAVLMQEGHPLAFYSKKLSHKMATTSTYVKELYAISQAVQKWRQYLLGRQFIIKTDHRSLKNLMTQVIQTLEQQQYLSKLLGFVYTIVYKPGKENEAADALSRLPETDLSESALQSYTEPVFNILPQLKVENEIDPELMAIHKALREGTNIDSHYSIKDGLLFYKGKIRISSQSQLRDSIINEFHSSPLGGHAGILRTYIRISSQFH